MEKNMIAQYANGFSVLASGDTEEVILAFSQNQPVFDEEDRSFKDTSAREVATIIMPLRMGEQLKDILEQIITKEKEKNEGK